VNSLLLLLGAGLLAGAMNALAGGGSFVSLPALIAAGLPSVTANASSTVALYPGGAASAFVYRRDLAPVGGVSLAPMLAVTVVGGLAGALLLLWTPSDLFDQVLPWLLLAALAALAFGRRLGAALHTRLRIGAGPVLAAQFALGVYGGYFGGAVGLMMMAAWSLLPHAELKALHAPRTLMVTAANTIAVLVFVAAHAVAWKETAVMALGAVVGGYLGAELGRRLPAPIVRAGTLLATAAITLAFFLRAYG
jgi:uncharacterized membrane protein YfcA